MNNAVEAVWTHVPNAVHISRIIDSVKARPDAWKAAYITAHGVPRDAARDAARAAARGDAARNAVLALIAHDDAAQYLDLTLDELKESYALAHHPAALLLQPAVAAFANINE
jgi:hypothetical protein